MSESIIILPSGMGPIDGYSLSGRRVDGEPVYYLTRLRDKRTLKVIWEPGFEIDGNFNDYFRQAAGEDN